MAEPFALERQPVTVTASIGIALSTSGYADVQDMLRDADIAMYNAKQQGRARWVMFDQTMQEKALRRCSSNRRCGWRSGAASCRCRTSRSSRPPTAGSTASGRCCAGPIRSTEQSVRPNSSRWPRKLA
jgi:hypothetical protein